MNWQSAILQLAVLVLFERTAAINYVRLVNDHICSTSDKSVQVDFGGAFATDEWSFGFWFKIPGGQLGTLPVMSISSLFNGLISYYVKYVTPTSYKFLRSTSNLFTIDAAGMLDDDNYYSIRRLDSHNKWHYLSFVFKKQLFFSEAGIALNDSNVNSSTYFFSFDQIQTKFIIGNDSTLKNCGANFHVHRLEMFDQPYNFHYGQALSQDQIFSAVGGPIAALYKLNRFPFAQALTNILDPTKYRAEVVTKAVSQQGLNLPKSVLDRFAVNGEECVITYSANLMPKSPTVNSYTFTIHYLIYGTQYLAKAFIDSSLLGVVPYSIAFYERAKSDGSLAKVILLDLTIEFENLIRQITLKNDNNIWFQSRDSSLTPASATDFKLDSWRFVTVQVKNHILMAKPEVSTCTQPSPACHGPFSIDVQLLDNDIHRSVMPEQNQHYFVYLIISEISFSHTPGMNFSASGITSGNIKDPINYFIPSIKDLKRFVDKSSAIASLTETIDVGTQNCSIPNCSQCDNGVCVLCSLRYYLTSGLCVFCNFDSVFDHVTYKCISSVTFSTTLLDLAPVINDLAQKKVVSINIVLQTRRILNDANSESLYSVVYFNSLQSLSYHPLETTVYFPEKIQAELAKLTVMFDKFMLNLSGIYLCESFKVIYAVDALAQFVIPNPNKFFLDNKCYSSTISYVPITSFLGTCGSGCLADYFYDSHINECSTCPSNCIKCNSGTQCMVCEDGYNLVNALCASPNQNNNDISTNPLTPISDASNSTLETENVTSNSTSHSDSSFSGNDSSLSGGNSSPPGSNSSPFVYSEEERAENNSYDEMTDLSVLSNASENKFVEQIIRTQIGNTTEPVISVETICKLGYIKVEGVCIQCPSGCLSCSDTSTCQKCDVNFVLSDRKYCILKINSVFNITKMKEPKSEDCDSCYQIHDKLSDGCSSCNKVCSCHASNKLPDSSFKITCKNTILDMPNISLASERGSFHLSALEGEFVLKVFVERSVTVYNFTVNPLLIKNTTGCFHPPNTKLKLLIESSVPLFAPINLSHDGKFIVSNTIDIATDSISLLLFPLANSLIGFLQFSKFFFYLSILDVRVGGVYDYVNFNLHAKENPIRTFLFFSGRKEQMAHIDWWHHTIRLAESRDLKKYILSVSACFLAIWIGKILRGRIKRRKLNKFGTQLELKAKKLLFIVSRKNLTLFVVGSSFIIRVICLIPFSLIQLFALLFVLVMIQIPIMIRFKALAYIQGDNSSQTAYFNTLCSRSQLQKNRSLMAAKIADELFIIARILFIYYLRHYVVIAFALSLCLIVGQIIFTIRYVKTIHVSVTVLVVLELISLFMFVLLMMLKYLGLYDLVIAFDVVYITSNVIKLVEMVLEIILEQSRNRYYRNQQKVLDRRRQQRNALV